VAFVGIGDTLADAEALAERGASSVSGPVRHRRDIGTDEALGRRMDHMKQTRAGAGS
jgi:phosphoribosylamine--glycine ligase